MYTGSGRSLKKNRLNVLLVLAANYKSSRHPPVVSRTSLLRKDRSTFPFTPSSGTLSHSIRLNTATVDKRPRVNKSKLATVTIATASFTSDRRSYVSDICVYVRALRARISLNISRAISREPAHLSTDVRMHRA